MGSPSAAIRKAYEEYERETNKNIQKAVDATMRVLKGRLEAKIAELAIHNYYGGYKPLKYERTYQLPKAIKPYVESKFNVDTYHIYFGPEMDESTMNHSGLGYGNDKDENLIMEMTIGNGYHAKVGFAGTANPIFNKDENGVLANAIEKILEELPNIFSANARL